MRSIQKTITTDITWNSPEITERFFRLAIFASKYIMQRWIHKNTLIDSDELINDCWLNGNWKKYLDHSDNAIIKFMKFRMMQYLVSQLPGRYRYKEYHVDSIDKCIEAGHEPVTFEEVGNKLSQLDEILFLTRNISDSTRRLQFIQKYMNGFSNAKLGKVYNLCGERMRQRNDESLIELREAI